MNITLKTLVMNNRPKEKFVQNLSSYFDDYDPTSF